LRQVAPAEKLRSVYLPPTATGTDLVLI